MPSVKEILNHTAKQIAKELATAIFSMLVMLENHRAWRRRKQK